MKNLLYIGENEAVLSVLKAQQGLSVQWVQNVIGFYNLLEKLDEFDIILASQYLKGIKGVEIFRRYKELLMQRRIPFILIHENFPIETRRSLIKEGIIEHVNGPEDLQNMQERGDFLQEMLQTRLAQKDKVKAPEYKIPLGKRIFDIVTASFAVLVLSPIYILTIIAIRLESKGPIFYISKRVGTGYRVFDFYKFRSMFVDAEARLKELSHLNQYGAEDESSSEEGQEEKSDQGGNKKVPEAEQVKGNSPLTLIHKDGTPISEEEYRELKRKQMAGTFVKIANDPRVTKVGKFIRNTSIDELPQIFNVLKGDMSIVGNRPLPLYEAEQLTSDDWGERFLAPAGITGLWQVEKRGKGSMSEEERKGLDNAYAKNFSFWNDIRLILKTIPALFQKENV